MRKGFKALTVSKTFLGTFALIVTSALSGVQHKDSNKTTNSHPTSTYAHSSAMRGGYSSASHSGG